MAGPKNLDRGGRGNYDRVQKPPSPLPKPNETFCSEDGCLLKFVFKENRGATPPFKSAHDGIGLQFIKFVFVTRCYDQSMLMII